MPADEIGVSMSWGEAIRLMNILQADPSSAIAAALAGWSYPISREALILMDHYDLDLAINTDPKKGRAKPHPGRPFESESTRERQRYGDTGGRTRAEIVEILNAHGHQLPV